MSADVTQIYDRFLDELCDAVGTFRLHEQGRRSAPGTSVDDDIVSAVRRMRETLDLLGSMLPEDYLAAHRTLADRDLTDDTKVIRAIASIISVWRADVWDKR